MEEKRRARERECGCHWCGLEIEESPLVKFCCVVFELLDLILCLSAMKIQAKKTATRSSEPYLESLGWASAKAQYLGPL